MLPKYQLGESPVEWKELLNLDIKIGFFWREIANLYWSGTECQERAEVLYIDYVT